MATPVEITDVTLRDGLQVESRVLPLAEKLALLEKLLACPYQRWEITSFVHPKWVPQFEGSDEFCAAVVKKYAAKPELFARFLAFVPNRRGLDRLLQTPIGWASTFISVTETFHKKNVNTSIVETLTELGPLVATAHAAKRRVRAYVSVAFGCPYEGRVSEKQVLAIVEAAAKAGADEVSLSDTIGVAVPAQVRSLIEAAARIVPRERLAMHFHDTYRCGVANALAAVDAGVVRLDGSTGGVGGCPYAKGATGNVPTEDVLHGLYRAGLEPLRDFAPVRSTVETLGTFGVATPGGIAAIWARSGTPY